MKDYIEKSKLNKPTKLYLILAVTFLLIGIGIIVGISVNESLKSVSTKNYVVTTGVVVDYKVYETNYNNSSTHKVICMPKLPNSILAVKSTGLQTA